MPDFDVRLEAVERLRHALVHFANRQQEAMAQIEQAIARTQADLDHAEQYWRREVEIRHAQATDCYARAAYAAAMGDWIDCSGYQQQLYEAEQELAAVKRLHYRLAQRVEAYEYAREQMQEGLAFDLSRSVTFLDQILAGLEAVLNLRSVVVSPPDIDLIGNTPTQIFFYDASSEIGSPISIPPVEKKEGDFGNPEHKG